MRPHIWLALLILLVANQCATHKAHAASALPPNYGFIYVLRMTEHNVYPDLLMDAYRSKETCERDANELRAKANSGVHFKCIKLTVLKE